MTIKRFFGAAVLAGLTLAGSGCAPVLQWQRQYLGDPIMLLAPDEQESSLINHIDPRREGSSGGDGGGGGGCGC